MKVHLDCYPCFVRQIIIALRLAEPDEQKREFFLKQVLKSLNNYDTSKTPAHTTTFLHREIRHILGRDPFGDVKQESNRFALGLYPQLKKKVALSEDPLWTAARLSIAGNIIDFGIFSSIDVEGTVDRALSSPLAVDDLIIFRKQLENVDEVLYLADNAGEIVFDRLLIEILNSMGKKVTMVVKGSPVINDSTIEDASQAGITSVCKVISNGSDAVGTILEWTSNDFKEVFSSAEFIISKGQGNFETLTGSKKKIFFLFQAKCEVISKELGLVNGSMLLMKS